VIVEPLAEGVMNVTVALVSPGDATRSVGAPGAPAGITELLAYEGTDISVPLSATTVKEYAEPSVNPVTTHESVSPELGTL
jgi:hypothetical protein